MKVIAKFLFIILITSINSASYAQDDLVKSTKVAVKASNYKDLAKNFHETINLKLLGDEGVYSKAQGEIVIRDFLKRYTIVDFQIIHQGQSKEGSLHYVVAKFVHSKGSLRVYMLIKQFHGNFFIDTLDFSEE